MKKKILSWLMVVCMISSLFSVMIPTTLAAETEGYYTYTVKNGAANLASAVKYLSGEVVIPETLGGYPVTNIATEAFIDCTKITKIYVPDTVTNLGYRSFRGCTSLVEARLGNGLLYVSDAAFFGCTNLKYVFFPKTLKVITSRAFDLCSSISAVYYGGTTEEWKSVQIQDNNTYITNAKVACNYKAAVKGLSIVVEAEVKTNDSFTIRPTFNPIYATNKSITWSSSDSNIATVDSTGKVTGVARGTAIITATSEDGGYTASCSVKVSSTVPEYTVTFAGMDGNVISTQTIESGKGATAPEVPEIDGYTFVAWDKDFSNVTSDMTVTAIYEKIPEYCTVTFLGMNDEYIWATKIENGESVEAPEAPEVEGYTFIGWDTDFSCVTSDLTIRAIYEPIPVQEYKVTFMGLNGEIIAEVMVKAGEGAQEPAEPAIDGYAFIGWDKDFSCVTEDMAVYAMYQKMPTFCTVTFLGMNDEYIWATKIESGEGVEAPEAPEVEGYTFVGWDKDFSCITEDTTIRAIYEPIPVPVHEYKVTFVGMYGEIIAEVMVKEGEAAEAPEAPMYNEYLFVDWDIDFSYVTEDMTVTAMYQYMRPASVFTVTFVGMNGEIIYAEDVMEGGSPAEPEEIPEVEGYVFVGWDTDFTIVNSDLTIKAIYEKIPEKEYTVTFVGFNGEVLAEVVVKEGEAAEAPDAPEVEGYVFVEWDNEFSYVTGDMTVNAIYEEIVPEPVFEVTFVGFDGEIIFVDHVMMGESAMVPDAPEVEGYTFIGWDKETSNVVDNMTVTAIYEPIPVPVHEYKVTFIGMNGEIIAEVMVKEGESAEAPELPEIDGYTFAGWDTDFTSVTSDLTVRAIYEPIPVPVYEYKVTFVGMDGEIIAEVMVKEGEAAEAPEAPAVEGYTFDGWSGDFSNVTENIKIYANYVRIDTPLPEKKYVRVSSTTAVSGSDVEITVTADEDINMAIGGIVIDFDRENLVYNGCEFSEILAETSNITNPEYVHDGKEKLYISFAGVTNISEGGVLFTLKFTIAEDAENGVVIPVTIDNIRFYNDEETKLDIAVENGEIRVINYETGDVSQDGVIDLIDVLRIMQYDIGSRDFDDVEMYLADVNRDGSVDIIDAFLVQKYDAGLVEGF